MMNRLSRAAVARTLGAVALAAAAGSAAAHTGHGTHGVVAGLVHPLHQRYHHPQKWTG